MSKQTMTPMDALETLRYCANHCDTDEERALVRWVAEKFGEQFYRDPRTVARYADQAAA
jgi:hypothetical protein